MRVSLLAVTARVEPSRPLKSQERGTSPSKTATNASTRRSQASSSPRRQAHTQRVLSHSTHASVYVHACVAAFSFAVVPAAAGAPPSPSLLRPPRVSYGQVLQLIQRRYAVGLRRLSVLPVSYTHLTLPTKRIV